ncbi:MAG: hypothetical protein JXQ71_13620 [Verrucomicrobia bacterium]|nr:hypothetical protein [Verrucomicrobiota bacterium]
MQFLKRWLAGAILNVPILLVATSLPRADVPISVTWPDLGAEMRAFDAPETKPVPWGPHVINAAWGEGRGGPERNGGWLDRNWEWVDYLDRSADYTTHEWLAHRGIWYEVYGNNEYQETIHFHEDGAKRLFWDNGIARDMNGERVLSEDYNMSVPSWAKAIGWNAYIVCNNAPRWSAVINYVWLVQRQRRVSLRHWPGDDARPEALDVHDRLSQTHAGPGRTRNGRGVRGRRRAVR